MMTSWFTLRSTTTCIIKTNHGIVNFHVYTWPRFLTTTSFSNYKSCHSELLLLLLLLLPSSSSITTTAAAATTTITKSNTTNTAAPTLITIIPHLELIDAWKMPDIDNGAPEDGLHGWVIEVLLELVEGELGHVDIIGPLYTSGNLLGGALGTSISHRELICS